MHSIVVTPYACWAWAGVAIVAAINAAMDAAVGDKFEKSTSYSLLHLNFDTATEPRLRAVRFLAVL
jgi:hypothetical protein